MKTKLLFILMIIVFAGNSVSQNVDNFVNYSTKYKDKDIVYLNIRTEVSVDIGKKGLNIEVTKSEDTYYNNYKAGAYSESNIESSNIAKLIDIEASTLFPDNNKFKEIKVKEFNTREILDDNIFYQDLFSTSFIFPSLRQGAITKLKYTLCISEPYFFPYEVVKRASPIENYEFVINSDENVVFDTKYLNTDSSNINFTMIEKNGRRIYTWKAKNIKSYKKESYAPDYLCFLPQIIPYIKSYPLKGLSVTVYSDLDELFKWKNSNVSKMDHMHTEAMIQSVASMTKNCISDIEKVIAVYQWVQNNIKYIANEYEMGGLIPRDPHVIFEKRYGDCKDMTAIIIELLDIAGIKAYYTWIGTRDIPYSYREIPTSIVSNHMIAMYIEKDNYLFLDGTDTYLPIFLPSSAIQGKEALIRLNNEKYEIYKVPEVPADTNVHADFLNLTIDQGKITGIGNAQLSGYYFSSMKHNIESIKDAVEEGKFMKSYLETGNNKCMIDNYEITNTYKNLQIDYKFSLSDHLIVNDNEMYINLNLSQPYNNFELFDENRELDFKFNFKSLQQADYILSIPSGYEINYLPNDTEFIGEDFSYSIHYEKIDNKVLYHFSLRTNILLLKPASFNQWNNMLKKMRSDFKEVVVLKKKI